jgi:hypothetical protein
VRLNGGLLQNFIWDRFIGAAEVIFQKDKNLPRLKSSGMFITILQMSSFRYIKIKLSVYSTLDDNPSSESKYAGPWYLLIKVVCALDGKKIILYLIQNNVPNKII